MYCAAYWATQRCTSFFLPAISFGFRYLEAIILSRRNLPQNWAPSNFLVQPIALFIHFSIWVLLTYFFFQHTWLCWSKFLLFSTKFHFSGAEFVMLAAKNMKWMGINTCFIKGWIKPVEVAQLDVHWLAVRQGRVRATPDWKTETTSIIAGGQKVASNWFEWNLPSHATH